MTRPVPLIRRFTQVPDHYQGPDVELDKVWDFIGGEERVGWPELEDLYRVVILADAGAGKTYELKAQAENMVARGRMAFFIRIEDIDANFGAAFEVGTPAAFERWLGGVEEAWFLLDSVDEVRLETPRAFEAAMRAFASRIHDAGQRAHVVVSSRPYAWNVKLDNDLIKELLPYEAGSDPADDDGASRGRGEAASNALKLYKLAPLDRDDIRLFAAHRGMSDTDAFIDAIERAALFDLAQLPFDLEDLIAIWRETGSVASRLKVLERGLERRVAPEAGTAGLAADKALSGARRLALAATLLNEANIRLPGGPRDGLEAARLLADWTEDEVRLLLGCGVFSDAIYSTVRFRHREARELLAAQQLAKILRTPERRAEVEALLFKTVYAETIIPPRARPLLPWLILYDEAIRDRALALAPEIATEGGDAALLPLEVRREILRDIVVRIAENDDRGGDNSQIARIAQDDLSDQALALIEAYGGHDGVVFFLGRLVWQGAMQTPAAALAPIALDPGRGIYARIVSARAVATVVGEEALQRLWATLSASGEVMPRQLLAELVAGAPSNSASVDLLLDSIDKAAAYARFETTGLTHAIHAFIDRLPLMSDRALDQPLVRLVAGLAGYLAREPYVERRECKISQAFNWLVGSATHAIERLVIMRSQRCFDPPALDVISAVPALRHWAESEDRVHKSKLAELVPRWSAFNDTLFWHCVAETRATRETEGKTLTDDWDVEWVGHFWSFDANSFQRSVDWISSRHFADDRSVALSRSFRTYVQNGRPRSWRRQLWRAVAGDAELQAKLSTLMRPPPSAERRRWNARSRKWTLQTRRRQEATERNRATWVARLKANPDHVRSPPGLTLGQVSRDQALLLQELRNFGSHLSRDAATGWPALIPEFGDAVAQALREAATSHWRRYRPLLRSEGAIDSTIPYPLIFGMVGLELEAGAGGNGLACLSADDAELALRYATKELNGFPIWFEPLYRAHRETGLRMVWGEARWDLTTRGGDQPMHSALHDLVYRAPWLHADLAPLLHDWLLEHGAPDQVALGYCRSIMLSGGLSPETLAALASLRINAAETPSNQLPAWFALWVDSDPDAAIPALTTRLSSMAVPDDARFAELFIVELVGGRRGSGGPKVGAWKTPANLKALYLLMHRHIRVSEDINRADGGVYSPELRDDAQDARSSLLSRLAEVPGEQTYRELLDLAEAHPEPAHRAWMRSLAHGRAIADGDTTLSLDQVVALIS